MRSAFVVVVARPGRSIPDHVARFLDERQAPLPFRSKADHRWRSTDGRTVVGCWQEGSKTEDGGYRWQANGAGIAVSAGAVRASGRPWGGESTWTSAVVDALSVRSAEGAVDHLRGLFTAAVVEPGGRGVVVNDPLAFSFLFHATSDDLIVVASHPALAAHAIAAPGARPARDALAVAGLAHTHDRVGAVTGYAGVTALPPGTYVELRAGHSPRLGHRPPPWLPTDGMRSMTPEEMLEASACEMEDEVLAAPTFPARRHLAEITGGKDSRLVLAAVLSSGSAAAFEFWTDGPADLPDVQIAGVLARELSLTHASGIRPGRYAEDHLGRITTYVDHTAGMHSFWMLKSPPVECDPWVRVNGLFGEGLRSKVQRDLASRDDALRFRQRRFGRLELLRPEAHAWWRKQVRRVLIDEAPPDATPLDLVDTFQWKERARNNFGLREHEGGIPRVYPLYSITAMRTAFALGDDARRAATVHREIMRRADPRLLTLPFAGAGFAGAGLVGATATPPPSPPVRASARTATPPASLAERMRTGAIDERLAALTEILNDRDNPVWDHVHRDRTLDALGRYGTLTNAERRELTGAATAAVWLRAP